jgi:N-methylhydantoinase B
VFRLSADADVTTRGDRLLRAPQGRDSGGPGVLGGFYRLTPDGRKERLASKMNNERFRSGEAFVVETTGGGGIGRPEERDVALVLRDLADGRVSAEAAVAMYGVVVTSQGDLDEEATSERRAQLAGSNG